MPDYIKLEDAKPGVKVRTDGGFTCVGRGAVRTISVDEHGDLFFRCRDGQHYLAGQLSEGDRLIGLYPATKARRDIPKERPPEHPQTPARTHLP